MVGSGLDEVSEGARDQKSFFFVNFAALPLVVFPSKWEPGETCFLEGFFLFAISIHFTFFPSVSSGRQSTGATVSGRTTVDNLLPYLASVAITLPVCQACQYSFDSRAAPLLHHSTYLESYYHDLCSLLSPPHPS